MSNGEQMQQQGHSDQILGRRDALKKVVVGAATAGIVWNAPKIEGISIAPNYAAASSMGPVSVSVTEFSTGATGGNAWNAGGTLALGPTGTIDINLFGGPYTGGSWAIGNFVAPPGCTDCTMTVTLLCPGQPVEVFGPFSLPALGGPLNCRPGPDLTLVAAATFAIDCV